MSSVKIAAGPLTLRKKPDRDIVVISSVSLTDFHINATPERRFLNPFELDICSLMRSIKIFGSPPSRSRSLAWCGPDAAIAGNPRAACGFRNPLRHASLSRHPAAWSSPAFPLCIGRNLRAGRISSDPLFFCVIARPAFGAKKNPGSAPGFFPFSIFGRSRLGRLIRPTSLPAGARSVGRTALG